ncbi:hypothetical protein N7451_008910 [Penicillium sp. IBT 35674x]|nr:hypothetical protein N7451_008910 [Penicillium sp. IBT 35674x]
MCWSRYETYNGPNGCRDHYYMGIFAANRQSSAPNKNTVFLQVVIYEIFRQYTDLKMRENLVTAQYAEA